MFRASLLWRRLSTHALSWGLPAPRVSASWADLPPALAPLAREGWIERPLLEPPARAADEDALQRETGLALPEDLRALHAVHDGSFAPLLPLGMTLLPYAAMLTTWRSFAALAEQFSGNAPTLSPDGTHLQVAYHRRWLPLATADEGALLLDFAPGPRGSQGQVLLQLDEARYAVVGASTKELLSRWVALLDEGRVRYSAEYGHAVPAGGERVEDLLRG